MGWCRFLLLLFPPSPFFWPFSPRSWLLGKLPRLECLRILLPARRCAPQQWSATFYGRSAQESSLSCRHTWSASRGVLFPHTSCQLAVKQGSWNALRAHPAAWPNHRWRISLRIECMLSIWLLLSTSTFVILSCHLMCRILRKHRKWKLLSCFVCLA